MVKLNLKSKFRLENFFWLTIKELDSRGIICSIASKNEFQLAWDELRELGLSDYFLFPKINWQPKSESISQIAKDLNIIRSSVE